MTFKRIPTGITGLDDLIEGGFPQGRSILLSGGTGTGKTIFCMQYLYEGATKFHEPGVYVTLDERPDLMREDMSRFGWDLRKLEDENMLSLIDGTIAKVGLPSEEQFSLPTTGFDLDKLLLEILRAVKRIEAKRIVIDSIPAMGLNFENENETRKAILKLSYLLMRSGVTSLLTTELSDKEGTFGKFGVEEYVADGVIVLHYMGLGMQSNRTLHIRKMRATKHSEDLHPLKISDQGVSVHKVEESFDV